MKFGEIRTISELLSGVEVALSPIVAESAFLEDAKKNRNSNRFFYHFLKLRCDTKIYRKS